MNRFRTLILTIHTCIFIVTLILAQTRADSVDEKKINTPNINLIELNISDKIFEMFYEIKNDTKNDIWICEDIAVFQYESDFEVYLAEDNQTLQISRRLEIESQVKPYIIHCGRYIRIQAGQIRAESLLLPLPIQSRIKYRPFRKSDILNTKRLSLQIGYYSGDLPDVIRGILEKAEDDKENANRNFDLIRQHIGSSLVFNWLNSLCTNGRHAGEEIIIPWIQNRVLGEKALELTLDNVNLPYKHTYNLPEVSVPDIANCTRLEIRFEPSSLEYFFPYLSERVLFSNREIEHLRSLKTIVLEDQEAIKAFAHNIMSAGTPGGIITEQSKAYVNCYCDDTQITSFAIYDDVSIITKDKERLRYKIGLLIPDTPITQIRALQLRLECADNLRNLWLMLRFLFRNRRVYPTSKWCDTIVQDKGGGDSRAEIWLKCPAKDVGKSHYAMNPNCKPDSPADMVLLFETKAGWNQQGGPELFTFDNHDPKGGCFLLNDGTVKFIRTKEELKQLRWK